MPKNKRSPKGDAPQQDDGIQKKTDHQKKPNRKKQKMARKSKGRRANHANHWNVPGNVPVNACPTPPRSILPSHQNEDKDKGISSYGPKASIKRLKAQGFHHLVTDMTFEEAQQEWHNKIHRSKQIPCRDDYLKGEVRKLQGGYSNRNILIDNMRLCDEKTHGIPKPLQPVFNGTWPNGLILGEHLASQGVMQLENIAKAHPQLWATLSQGMAVWDFSKNTFEGTPSGNVLICVFPKISQHDFLHSLDLDVLRENERDARNNIVQLIENLLDCCKTTQPYWWPAEKKKREKEGLSPEVESFMETCPGGIIKKVQALPDTDHIEVTIEEKIDPPANLEHYMYKQVALKHMFGMLTAIFNRRTLSHVLILQHIPLLDRRLVAIILRACPHVTTLGIYECPLLHLGDVITLLDLIYEVNLERDKKNLPRVESFDFYPRYHGGMPYSKNTNDVDDGCYGMTWNWIRDSVAQQGLMTILLKAVLKSREMGIGLLMDKGAAFMQYLSKIPLPSLSVFVFLDGLHRYLDLKKARFRDQNAIKQAIYDLLKGVKTGLESPKKFNHSNYQFKMGKETHLCCSCGYELLSEFFTASQAGNRPESKVCAGCYLQGCLDIEDDHHKQEGKDLMTLFYPGWNPKGFNIDAPVHKDGSDILRLRTRRTVRVPPMMTMLPNGNFHTSQAEFARDNKQSDDCVLGLPDLQTLLAEKAKYREEAKQFALHVDTERVICLLLRWLYPDYAIQEPCGGTHDHFDERQEKRPPSDSNMPRMTIVEPFKASHTFSSAKLKEEELELDEKIAAGEVSHMEKPGFW
ncbi:hypothetical protein F53441_7302 [Fusarium austroafricanum]|uniref:Uncharacterized protein n=1 Tax=Fusarium austroafricanum TaxID=2364996 RepID=A0A8H4KDU0_9HYPO|nr:hypothetical protein F53441_7302 [Fusarium austroafricanum]